MTTTDSVTNSLRFLDSIPRSVSPAVFSEAEKEAQETERALGKYAKEGEREERRENLQGNSDRVKGSPLGNDCVFQVLV